MLLGLLVLEGEPSRVRALGLLEGASRVWGMAPCLGSSRLLVEYFGLDLSLGGCCLGKHQSLNYLRVDMSDSQCKFH